MEQGATDIIIVGGGVAGLGVARAATAMGRRALLLEMERCGGGASSGSLRIMHGGFRYLQHLNLLRILESIEAQSELLHEFPDLVQPLVCAMPLAQVGLKSGVPALLGLKMFELIRRLKGKSGSAGTVLDASDAVREVPLLDGVVPYGALVWRDALLLDHQALVARLVSQIQERGCQVEEHCRVSSIEKDGDRWTVQAEQGGGLRTWSARSVVNATGAWIEGVSPLSWKDARRASYWCKAFNVIISRRLTEQHGVGTHSHEGRLYFTVPRGAGSALGTAYLPFSGDPSQAQVNEQELNDFLASFNRTFPQARVHREEVIGVEHGVLPTLSPDPLSLRGRTRFWQRDGYLEILSTKYTTFLVQGREVMRRLGE